ncbi:MAG: helix-turn-helix transcriptional regulator [Lachnospiraceae bacterium]
MKIQIMNVYNITFAAEDYLEHSRHDGYELIYFFSGKGFVTFAGIKKPFVANDLFLIKVGDKREQLLTETGVSICVRFKCSQMHELESDVYTVNSPELYHLFRGIAKEYAEKKHEYYNICNAKIYEVLFYLMRQSKEKSLSVDTMLDLIHEIDATLWYDESVEEMAKKTNYSYDHFRHKFKQLTGKSPYAYITSKKIEHACELLSDKRYTNKEIANLLGFSSASQFCKVFKKETGVSPSSYKG